MLAIFMYVGGEVTVGSAIINFLGTDKLGGLAQERPASYLAFYWGGLMIGRFMGAFALERHAGVAQTRAGGVVPMAALVSAGAARRIAGALQSGLGAERRREVVQPANARALRRAAGLAVRGVLPRRNRARTGCWPCSAR